MSVFEKMNLKDQDAILVLDAPASFEPELKALEGVTVHSARGAREGRRVLPRVRHLTA